MRDTDGMVDRYYAGAYWLARQESAESCAQRAHGLFESLGRIEPTWRQWYETARTFEEAREHPVSTDSTAFLKLFARRKNRVGDGFRYWLWAGHHADESARVDGLCGSAADWQPSTCVFEPPEQGAPAERVLTTTVLAEVLRAMVQSWEPEWGVVTSEQHRELVAPAATVGTFTGWMTYFSRQRGTVPPLPAPVHVEPVGDLGTLVVLTPERFTVTNPEHVRLAAEVQQVLNDAGLLHPLRPLS